MKIKKDSNKTRLNKYERFALKNNGISITIYVIFIVLIIISLANFLAADKKDGPVAVFMVGILISSFLGFLLIMKIHSNDCWQKLIKEAKEEAREKYTGVPAAVRGNRWYKIKKVLYSKCLGTPHDKIYSVIFEMIGSRYFEDFPLKSLDRKAPCPSSGLKGRERVYSFYCSDDQDGYLLKILSPSFEGGIIHISLDKDLSNAGHGAVWRVVGFSKDH